MKLLSTKTETLITNVYQLNNIFSLVEYIKDDIITNRTILYTGKKLKKLEYLHPTLVNDIFFDSIKIINPFTIDIKDYKQDLLSIDLNKIDITKIVIIYTSGHLLFNHNEELLPTIYYIDYIDGSINNKYYNLEKLLPYLMEHKDVLKYENIKKYYEFKEEKYLNIIDIPYYNADDDKNKYIKFFVLPEQKWMNDTFFKLLNSDNKYPTTTLKNNIVNCLNIAKFKIK